MLHTHHYDEYLKGNDERILLVEDSADTQESLSTILRAFNYRVLSTTSVEEAVTVAPVHLSDVKLVVVDRILSEARSMEFARHLRNLHANLLILYLYGHGYDIHSTTFENTTHLRKPVHPYQMLKYVKEMLSYDLDTCPKES